MNMSELARWLQRVLAEALSVFSQSLNRHSVGLQPALSPISNRQRADRGWRAETSAGPAGGDALLPRRMRRRVRRSVLYPLYSILAVGACAVLTFPTFATPPPMGVAPVVVPSGGFAIDGNLLANIPATNVGDWLFWTNTPGAGAGVLNGAGAPLNPATTFHIVDPYNGNDSTFAGGLKWTDDPNTWQWTTGKGSGKTDINNVMVHISTDTNGHVWAILSADRLSTSGDSYIDFEFLQNTLLKNTNGTVTSHGVNRSEERRVGKECRSRWSPY